MGRITQRLLETMEIRHAPFPRAEDALAPALETALSHMRTAALPFAFVMEKDSVRDDGLDQAAPAPRPAGASSDLRRNGARPIRSAILARFLDIVPTDAAVVATTGKCGRELFTLADRDQHLYQVGSMGGASAMGLGLALNTKRPVVVLDGDGAALMKMGNLATIGAHAPQNLIHIVLDNGTHDSTGGQATVSPSVDFASAALACGYGNAARCDAETGFEQAFRAALAAQGPALIHARIAPGSMERLGRPTVAPKDVARRFRAFVTGP
jgi:phosphonopyruvate decarboxylase